MLKLTRKINETLRVDPTSFVQPADTHWCIPVGLSFAAKICGQNVTTTEIIKQFLDDHGGKNVTADQVKTDSELRRRVGQSFGPGFVRSLKNLCGEAITAIEKDKGAGMTPSRIVDTIRNSLNNGHPVLTSLRLSDSTLDTSEAGFDLKPSIHIVPWIGKSASPEQFIAWEPVSGCYISASSRDIENALADDLWQCQIRRQG